MSPFRPRGFPRRSRRGRATGDADPWRLEHSPLTFEGRVEGTGRFFRGMRDAVVGDSPRMKVAFRVATVVGLAALVLTPLVRALMG